MEKRLGFVGIVLENRSHAPAVNAIISQYASLIRARVGVPDTEEDAAVIGLIVQGDDLSLGALTAKLGNLEGVQVKSALTKKSMNKEPHKDE